MRSACSGHCSLQSVLCVVLVCIRGGFGMYQRWVQYAGIVVCSVVLSVSKSHCMPHTTVCIVCGFVSEVGWLNAHAAGGESGAGWV